MRSLCGKRGRGQGIIGECPRNPPEDLAAARRIFGGHHAPTTWRRRSLVYDDGERGIGTALEAVEVLVRQGITFRVEPMAAARSERGDAR
jgi:hypothetical protein